MRQFLDRLRETRVLLFVPALAASSLPVFAGVEVVLAGGALQNFAALRDLEPFGDSIMRFHRGFRVGKYYAFPTIVVNCPP